MGIVLSKILLDGMVNRTRVDGGDYSEHDFVTRYLVHDMVNRQVVNIIADMIT